MYKYYDIKHNLINNKNNLCKKVLNVNYTRTPKYCKHFVVAGALVYSDYSFKWDVSYLHRKIVKKRLEFSDFIMAEN